MSKNCSTCYFSDFNPCDSCDDSYSEWKTKKLGVQYIYITSLQEELERYQNRVKLLEKRLLKIELISKGMEDNAL